MTLTAIPAAAAVSRVWLRGWWVLALGLAFGLAASAGAAPGWHTSPRASVLVVGGSMMNGDQFAASVLPAMRAHYAGCRKVALVLHPSHPTERDRMEARLAKAFAHVGVPAAESLHRRDEAGARELLRTADAIFVGGGETFVLLAELHRTGQLALIRERVLAGVPFGGSSAGANVAGLVIGTTNDFPVTDVPSREALGLLPVSINPHHPLPAQKADYDARVGKILGYLKFNPGEIVLALANASIVRLHEGRAALVTGEGWIYTRAGQRTLKRDEPVPELSR
ncbi:MAG: Type 1 glutamine amidotransferase-like domain-containing protein [Opitutaceae bacterium]|nr:Type 1 glutamine amidotransferase-like domain-containing protein [Opitutaceae bacterium]